jgi:hypothetical protein
VSLTSHPEPAASASLGGDERRVGKRVSTELTEMGEGMENSDNV